MTRTFTSLLVLCVTAGTALAQSPGADPGQPPPAPYPAPPAPYPAPPAPQPMPYPNGGYAPPPQGYVPVQLSRDDAELLQKGEITDTQHAGGVVANVLFGFGVGQAIQGRYGDT